MTDVSKELELLPGAVEEGYELKLELCWALLPDTVDISKELDVCVALLVSRAVDDGELELCCLLLLPRAAVGSGELEIELF
jgi:hypothetical protein